MKTHFPANLRYYNGYLPQLGKNVFIDPSAAVIGQVTLSDDCSVWPMSVIRGDMHSITVGARTSIQDSCVLHITHASPYNINGWPLVIGEDCTIAHHVTLHGCQLGSRVLVGIGSIVMDGAIIADNVVIGANSLVPPGKTLQSGFLYMGSPAKEIRKLSDKEMAFFTYSANNYVKLKNQYLKEMSKQN